MIIVNQVSSVGNKVWMKTWGEAYGQHNASLSMAPIFVQSNSQQYVHMYMHSAPVTTTIDLPSAREHPLCVFYRFRGRTDLHMHRFYVGVFVAIGFVVAISNLLSNVILIMGSIRASRLMFERLLRGVVRATMRWHVRSPSAHLYAYFDSRRFTGCHSSRFSLILAFLGLV